VSEILQLLPEVRVLEILFKLTPLHVTRSLGQLFNTIFQFSSSLSAIIHSVIDIIPILIERKAGIC
jgi:hypothetical protein